MTGCTDAQEVAAGDSSAAPRFFFLFVTEYHRKDNIQVVPDTKKETCAAAFCFSSRRTIQLPGIPAQSALTADDSSPPAENCCANTHQLKGKGNSLCTEHLNSRAT